MCLLSNKIYVSLMLKSNDYVYFANLVLLHRRNIMLKKTVQKKKSQALTLKYLINSEMKMKKKVNELKTKLASQQSLFTSRVGKFINATIALRNLTCQTEQNCDKISNC